MTEDERSLQSFRDLLTRHGEEFHPVVPFDPGRDRLCPMDFTGSNKTLTPERVGNTDLFSRYIEETLKLQGARYGIGGYAEHRTIYARSRHFDALAGEEEPRRLHLGTDIWGPAGTRIMAPLDGFVHSFAFNHHDGDYGATIILTHRIEDISFQILYGHLSLNSLKNLQEGKRIYKGEVFTEFGMRFENGNWPAHLHFQLIRDMGDRTGDYPGVCRFSERARWLLNSPDPDLVLRMNRYLPR